MNATRKNAQAIISLSSFLDLSIMRTKSHVPLFETSTSPVHQLCLIPFQIQDLSIPEGAYRSDRIYSTNATHSFLDKLQTIAIDSLSTIIIS
jgi:hypothetical protein